MPNRATVWLGLEQRDLTHVLHSEVTRNVVEPALGHPVYHTILVPASVIWLVGQPCYITWQWLLAVVENKLSLLIYVIGAGSDIICVTEPLGEVPSELVFFIVVDFEQVATLSDTSCVILLDVEGSHLFASQIDSVFVDSRYLIFVQINGRLNS